MKPKNHQIDYVEKYDLVIRFIFLLGLLQVVLIKFQTTQNISFYPLLDESIALVSFIYLFLSIKGLFAIKEFRKLLLFYSLFALMGFWSLYRTKFISYGYGTLQLFLDSKFLLIITTVAIFSTKIKDINALRKWVVKIFKIILIFNLFFVFIQYFFYPFFVSVFNTEGAEARFPIFGILVDRAIGVFWHPSELATFTCFAALVFGYFEKNKFYLFLTLIQLILSVQRFEMTVLLLISAYLFLYIKKQKDTLRPRLVFRIFISLVLFSLIFIKVFQDSFDMIFANQLLTEVEEPRLNFFLKGFEIVYDYFPFGTGFGTYAGFIAATQDSYVYHLYDFVFFWFYRNEVYMFDTYLPHIFGETGVLGLLFYLMVYYYLFKFLIKINNNINAKIGYVFTFGFMFIGILTAPVINNSLAIILASIVPVAFSRDKFE